MNSKKKGITLDRIKLQSGTDIKEKLLGHNYIDPNNLNMKPQELYTAFNTSQNKLLIEHELFTEIKSASDTISYKCIGKLMQEKRRCEDEEILKEINKKTRTRVRHIRINKLKRFITKGCEFLKSKRHAWKWLKTQSRLNVSETDNTPLTDAVTGTNDLEKARSQKNT